MGSKIGMEPHNEGIFDITIVPGADININCADHWGNKDINYNSSIAARRIAYLNYYSKNCGTFHNRVMVTICVISELKSQRSILSVNIKNVTIEDSGDYFCYMQPGLDMNGEFKIFQTNIRVHITGVFLDIIMTLFSVFLVGILI